MFRLSPPPSMTQLQDSDKKIAVVYTYLFQMSNYLNVALNNLTAENFNTETAKTINAATTSEKALSEQAGSLQALIIKTAETVRHEMDVIEVNLAEKYEAISNDFGEYKESASSRITATALGVLQEYGYNSILDALQSDMADFDTYRTTTQNYIKTGLLYHNEEEEPVYGVAIGTDVNNPQSHTATFTADKLSFWNNGVEIAYVSNSTLYITDARIQRLWLGKWAIRDRKGFTIKNTRRST